MLRSTAVVQRLVFSLLLASSLSASGTAPMAPPALLATQSVDYRYKPATWNTLISISDDWQKTLVSETGALLYDFPGPHNAFKTVVSAGVAGQTMKTTFQRLEDAKTPIVYTTSAASGITLEQQAFAIVDSPFKAGVKVRLKRVGREYTSKGWAKPPTGTDSAFQNIAIGNGHPIQYNYDLESGGMRTVAVGLIEGWWKIAGKRPLLVEVEGAPAQTLDVVALVGHNQPLVALFDGRDVDGDGRIAIAVRPVKTAPDKTTILSALWVFPAGSRPATADIVSGSLNASAEAFSSCGTNADLPTYAARRDFLHLDYRGSNFQPVVRLETTRTVTFDSTTGLVKLNGKPFLFSQPAPITVQDHGGTTVLLYPKSTTQIDVVVVNGPDITASALRPADFVLEHGRALKYWQGLQLPYDRIHVPDAGIQDLLDSSVRNIFQARDIKAGKAEFRVGPTMYRDIWLVDGSFLLEVAVELGVVDEARAAIEKILEYQLPSGQVIVLQTNFYKETGIMMWILQRHAQLTEDKVWLEARWKHVQDGVKWIKEMRKIASKDPNAPYAGLIPPGHADGGIGGPKQSDAEYTNVYWSLNGMKAAIEAAKWLGRTSEASEWQTEYDDFLTTFQRAAARDMKTDAYGNRYLPILMNPGPNDLGQKAQWAFCQAIFPGKVLAANDPIATGTLAMLDAVNSEGLVLSTGWMTGGIWTYFGLFYAHAHLWMGGDQHIKKAQDILYAFANHASPLLAWREEQKPVGQGLEMVGDMPHNWASGEFIRLVRHMIALERGDRLVLFEGIPAKWLVAGGEIQLRDIATEFGHLTVSARVSSDGRTVDIEMKELGQGIQPGEPVVNLAVFKQAGFKDVNGQPLPTEYVGQWGQPLRLQLRK
ncbi:MAG: hypothetical protein AAB250_18175, partial [Bdellovibrionota bacterium]